MTSLDSKLQIAKVQAANDLSLSCLKMPSGAGHDSAVVANLKRSDGSTIPVGMSFVPNKGLSHSPTEHATLESISAGATHMIQSAANYVRAVY